MIVSHFSHFIILLLGGGDVIETLGGQKTLVLKVVLCTCFTDPRFLAFIHFGPFYMFVRIAVHLYTCYFVKVSNQIKSFLVTELKATSVNHHKTLWVAAVEDSLKNNGSVPRFPRVKIRRRALCHCCKEIWYYVNYT